MEGVRGELNMETLTELLRKEIEEYADRHRLSDSRKRSLVERVKEIYNKSLYDSEEPIGIIAAQSLSEPATQMTMRTYHFAGTAGIQVTLGLPRLLEIFDARKEPKTPTMTIFLKEDYQSVDKAKHIAEHIREVKAKDAILSTTVDLTELWIKCQLNFTKLDELGIPREKANKLIKMRNAETVLEGDVLVVKPKTADLKTIHKFKYSVLESHIKGIKGISQVVVTKEGDEWIITTLGSNLAKVFEIEGVDYTRTYSNNIFEIYEVLGVEAARNAIISQSKYTIEEQGLGIDIRYIMLLADLMTASGEIKAIGRYGIAGQKASVLVRASFEETKKHLIGASVRGEKDPLKGTIENIMMNQVAPIGTGSYDLVGRMPTGFIRSSGSPKPSRKAKPKSARKTTSKKPKPKKKSK
jgi:DNA-directed RNA polymerase subunit A"